MGLDSVAGILGFTWIEKKAWSGIGRGPTFVSMIFLSSTNFGVLNTEKPEIMPSVIWTIPAAEWHIKAGWEEQLLRLFITANNIERGCPLLWHIPFIHPQK